MGFNSAFKELMILGNLKYGIRCNFNVTILIKFREIRSNGSKFEIEGYSEGTITS